MPILGVRKRTKLLVMKQIKWFALLATAIVLCFGTVSCGGDDPSPSTQSGTSGGGNDGGDGGDGGDSGGGDSDTPMTQQEQKEFLEKTAKELIAQIPASDFQPYADLEKEVAASNLKNVENWMNDLFNRTRETLGEKQTGSDTYTSTYGEDTYINYYYYIQRDYRSAIEIANYKGHFEVQNGVWVATAQDTEDLMFTFVDSKGVTWVLRGVTSGAIKRVHAYDTKSYSYIWDSSSSGHTYYYFSSRYTNIEQHILAVPEHIQVTLTKNSTQVMKTTLNINLSDIANEEFDISRDNLSLNVCTELDNYKVDIQQVVYNHNQNVALSTAVSKGGTNLVTLAISSNVKDLPSCNISAFSTLGIKAVGDNGNANNAYVKIDVLGKVQVQGKVSEVRSMVERIRAAQNSQTEADVKANIAQANTYYDLGVFYNNKSLKQAVVYIEPFANPDARHYNRYKWNADLVIKFGDESSYSLLTNFFSETNFKSVVDDLTALSDSYSKLFQRE